MRVLAVCESAPTIDSDQTTDAAVIAASLLTRLPAALEVDLAYFEDRPAPPDRRVVARCRSVTALPVRNGALSAAAVRGRLPRETWARATRGAVREVGRLAGHVDVAWFHGLHTFGLLGRVAVPTVVHEVRAWSAVWRDRAERSHRPIAAYARSQAARAADLERDAAAIANRYLVVDAQEATLLSAATGRWVDGLPNGVDIARFAPMGRGDPLRVGFVGALDDRANVAAARFLARDVMPRVRSRVPGARLVVSGRRPDRAVLELRSRHVDVRADVADEREICGGCAVIVYPGSGARGTRSRVLEAMSMGRAVVASPDAIRGIGGANVIVAAGTVATADAVAKLLGDRDAQRELGDAARSFVVRRASWDAVATRFAQILAEAETARRIRLTQVATRPRTAEPAPRSSARQRSA